MLLATDSVRCVRRQPSNREYYEKYDNEYLANFRKVLIHIVVQLKHVVKQVTALTIVFVSLTACDSGKVKYHFHASTSHSCIRALVSV